MKLSKRFLTLGAALVLSAVAAAAQAVVINIDAKRPGFAVTQTLAAGTYDISWIGRAGGGAFDAWSAAMSGLTPVLFRDAFVISFNGGAAQSFGDYGPYANDTAAAALTFAQAHPATFTLTAPATAVFTIPDNIYSDNTGGVSIALTQAVPEPETYAMMLAGLGALVWVGRRRGIAGTKG